MKTKSWLRGCKSRSFKKHFGSRMDVDGTFVNFHQYAEHIAGWKKMSIGDPVFNTFRNRWETLKSIDARWIKIRGFRDARYLDITGVTDQGFMVYEYDAEKYSLPEDEWFKFKKEFGIPE